MMPTIKEKWKEKKGKERKNEIHLENDWLFSRPMFTRVFFFFFFFFFYIFFFFFFAVIVPFFQHPVRYRSLGLLHRGRTKSSEIGEGCRIFWISTVFSRISLKRQRSFSCASRFSARGASSMQGFGSATTRSCYRSLLSLSLFSLSLSLSFSIFFCRVPCLSC